MENYLKNCLKNDFCSYKFIIKYCLYQEIEQKIQGENNAIFKRRI